MTLKKILGCLLAFLIQSGTSAVAQESPLRCSINKVDINCGGIDPYGRGCRPVWGSQINCSFREDNSQLEAVNLNRGRCMWQDNLRIIGKTYNFGDRVSVLAGQCNLLEFSFKVNGQIWTWEIED